MEFNPESFPSKETFRRFEDGYYNKHVLESKHNNIVQGVITAKKAWGLHVKMWSQGIAEGNFTKLEILEVFTKNNITIPDPLLEDFNNWVWKERFKYHDNVLRNREKFV